MGQLIKKSFVFVALASIVVGCASNPHKARKIETEMEKSSRVSGDTHVGVKDGNMVVQKKVQMNEELRRIQNEVYSLEDQVYGNRKLGSDGLYGALKNCRKKVTSKKNGGTGKLMWTEPMDRVTDKEDEWEVGIDEKDKIVGVSEEFLLDRIKRFKDYKRTLQKRQDEYKEKLDICDAKIEAQKYDLEKAKKDK